MFGYIKPCKPELKIKDYEMFKAIYCGLCLQLGKSFGFLARLTLSYDFVFLAMINYSQTEAEPEVYRGRCCVNPFNKVPLCKTDKTMVYSADVAAVMVHNKVKDNIQDSGFFGRLGWRFLGLFSGRAFKKAAKRQPYATEVFAKMMKMQREVEESKSSSIDRACEPTAWALSQLMESLSKSEENKLALRRLGYLVGRYIYLCDALEDLQGDIKSKSYNPFIYKCLQEGSGKDEIAKATEYAKEALFFTVSEISGVSKDIEFRSFSPILENITDFGMLGGINQILAKEGRRNNEKPI